MVFRWVLAGLGAVIAVFWVVRLLQDGSVLASWLGLLAGACIVIVNVRAVLRARRAARDESAAVPGFGPTSARN